MSARVWPFANGTQFLDWEESNCCRCVKYDDAGERCDLRAALLDAALDDGSIDAGVAARLQVDKSRYSWPCGEWEKA